ncbi:MAG: hypothetical protein AB8G95_12885 [Anaerolineae bacterium]
MGLNEGQAAELTSPQDQLTTNASGPLPPASEDKDFRDTNWFQSDSSLADETKKHKIWDGTQPQNGDTIPDWLENSNSSTSDEDATRKNKIISTEIESNADSEDIDILSILDLQLDSEELVEPEPPRQLSKDQLTPTDWISELVPQDSELPTMADMLPEPTPMDPGTEIESANEPDTVMDILFGESESLETDDDKPDTVSGLKPELEEAEGPEIAEQATLSPQPPSTGELEELTMNSWLTDIMSDMPEENDQDLEIANNEVAEAAEVGDELPDWLDFSSPAESSPFDHPESLENDTYSEPSVLEPNVSMDAFDNSHAVMQPAVPEKLEAPDESLEENNKSIVEDDNEEKASNKMSQDNNLDPWDNELEDDSLDWLADDLDDPDEPQPIQENVAKQKNHLQTRDLSQTDLPLELTEDEEDAVSGAVQAELPNWIKEMAPDANNESVIIPDEDNFKMNDDALSEIISAMESELSLGQDDASLDEAVDLEEQPAQESTPAFEADDSQILETLVSKHTEPLPKFDMSAPDFEEVSYFQSDADIESPETVEDSVEMEAEEIQVPSEEELLLDAISAIESEVNDLKETNHIPELNLDDDLDLPEWLPTDSESTFAESAATVTTDLPDWLQKPQVEDAKLVDPAELGFSEATVEEVHAISHDELPSSPADELDEIISEHAADELSLDVPAHDDDSENSDTLLEEPQDELAQFDWGDIEGDFETVAEFDLSQTDDEPIESLFQSEESGFLDELIAESDDSEAATAVDDSFLPEDDAEESSDFDWLDGESIDSEILGLDDPLVDAQLEGTEEIEDFLENDQTDVTMDAFEAAVPDGQPELDLLEEPAILVPDPVLDSESIPADFEDSILEVDSAVDSDGDQAEDDIDMSAWDEMDDAFSPLVEFEDETDVFSAIRDTPRIEETISAESLAGYISKPDWEIEPEPSEEVLESGDDFLSSFTEDAHDDVELPSWANELSSVAAGPDKTTGAVSGRNPLFGIENIVDVAPVVANPVQDLKNLHAPQMMEPVAHRKRAHLAAQAAGTVPMSDPTQPVVVPKARQRYQPRFNPTQFDGRPNQEKKKRSRQIGFIVVVAVLALMVGIAFAIPYILSFFSG